MTGPVTQAVILISLFSGSALLQYYCQPYVLRSEESDPLNRMEFVSMIGLVIVIALGIMLNNEFELQITNLGISSNDVTYTKGAVTGTVLIIVALSILMIVFVVQIFRHPYTAEVGARPTALILHGDNFAQANGGLSNTAANGGSSRRGSNRGGSNAVHPEEAVTNAGTSEGGGSKVSSSMNPLKVPVSRVGWGPKGPSSPPSGMDPVTVLQQDNDRVREELRKVQAEMEGKIKELERENRDNRDNRDSMLRVQAERDRVLADKEELVDSLRKEVMMLRGEMDKKVNGPQG